MINQQLPDYIKQQLQQGINGEQIKSSLLAIGWQTKDIDETFLQITNQNPATQVNSYISPNRTAENRKAKTRLILIVIGIVVLIIFTIGMYFVATGQQTVVAKFLNIGSFALEKQAYSNAKYGFQINAPKGWSMDESGKFETTVLFLSTQANKEGEKNSNAGISVVSKPSMGLILDAYANVVKKALPSKLQDYKLTDEKTLSVNGEKARIISGTFTQNALHLKILQLIVVKNDKAHVVSGVALESAWNQYKDLIESSLLTFKLK